MSTSAHSDAPQADRLTQQIYNLILRQSPIEKIHDQLFGEFNLASRLETAPGYIQANGFVTFKLGGVNGDQLLRLHFWPKDLPDAGDTSGVHDHVFDFTSLVLTGDGPMINTIHTPVHSEEGHLNLFEVEYTDPKTSHIHKLGESFKTAASEVSVIAPGEYYTLKSGIFHTSRIRDNAEAITLLATSINPEASPRPRYFSTAGAIQNYKRPAITDELRQRVITRVNACQ